MKDFKIEVSDNAGFKKISSNSIILNLVATVILSAIIAYESELSYGLGFGLIFLAIQAFKSNRSNKYFILSITSKAGKINLIYNEFGNKKEIEDDAAQFEFKKKTAISKSRIVYLAVYHQGSLIIEQAEQGDWNEAKFDEVLKMVNE